MFKCEPLFSTFQLDLSLNIQPGCLYMNLLKPEDFKRNIEAIAVGYGKKFDAERHTTGLLTFASLIVHIDDDVNFNKTFSIIQLSKRICPGRP